MRGEYPTIILTTVEPHGTTSACAENTTRVLFIHVQKWNYLRVRGEYLMGEIRNQEDLELPPRARRIRGDIVQGFHAGGTTSACAENTAGCAGAGSGGRNYLRVRGEYLDCSSAATWSAELPPRARRIPLNGVVSTSP